MLLAVAFLPPPHGALAWSGVAASVPARPARLPHSASSPSSKDHRPRSLPEDGLHRTLTNDTQCDCTFNFLDGQSCDTESKRLPMDLLILSFSQQRLLRAIHRPLVKRSRDAGGPG